MTNTNSSTIVAPRQPGRLTQALIRMFMKHTFVLGVEPIGEGFQLITLESPDFKGVTWIPGQKIQLALGASFTSRTYTPIEWDAVAGRTRIIGYVHGAGPGADWVRTAQPGDECEAFGPRASLDVSRLSGPILLFGDETAFGLALAMRRQPYADAVQFIFEVNSIEKSEHVLSHLGFGARRTFERQAGDTHLQDIEQLLPAFAQSNATFVLAGKSTSVQRVRQALKGLDVPTTRVMTKAYWAPGKTGLD